MPNLILATYSFADVFGAITGPGGSVAIGGQNGNDEGGITIEAIEDINRLVTGADGSGMHVLNPTRSGRLTIRALKTSPINVQLMNLQNYQRSTSLRHGRNVATVTNPVTGDSYAFEGGAFERVPNNTFAKDATALDWAIVFIAMYQTLGAGVSV